MSSLQRLGVITRHELRLASRDVISPLVLIVFPIIAVAFLQPAFRPALVQHGFPHANGAEQVVPGQAAMDAFFLVSLVTFSFFAEHSWGTWDRVRASAASSLEIVVGKAVPRLAVGVTQLALLLAVGVVFFHLHIRGEALALAPLVVAFSLCLVVLGVCVTALCRTAQQASAFVYLGMVVFGAIGGAFVPLVLLPAWARTVAPVTPTYWVMRGMHSVILDGRGLGATALPVVVLCGMSLLCALIALRRLRFADHKVGWF